MTTAKLVELRTALKERDEPLSNATINTMFASLSAAFSYFIEQKLAPGEPAQVHRQPRDHR